MSDSVSVHDIDALLPQTQCGECGYPGCMPYATAIKSGAATIEKCPPGGVALVRDLGKLLQIDSSPFIEYAKEHTRSPAVAEIREDECIGCTKCIQACPVDSIIGSGKLMHTVLLDECTGCGLCVEPCPVDCIEMVSRPEENSYDKSLARSRFEARKIRQLRESEANAARYREKKKLTLEKDASINDKQAKQAYILAAMARVNSKKNHE